MTDANQPDTLDLRGYLTVLRRHWVLVLLPAVLLVGAAAALVYTETPLYQSSTQLAIEPVRSSQDASFEDFILGNAVIDTEELVLTSRPVTQRVIDNLQLNADPSSLTDRINVSQVNETRVVRITATHPDPRTAADLANGFAQAYLEFRRDQALDDISSARSSLEERATELRDQINDLEQQIRLDTLNEAGTATPDSTSLQAERDTLVQRLAGVEDQLATIGTSADDLRGGGEVLVPAEPSRSPVSPEPTRTLPLAAVLGLVLGIGLALLRDHLDDVIRTEDDVHRAGKGNPIVARVTAWEDQDADNKLITLIDPYAGASEEFQALAANVRFALISRAPADEGSHEHDRRSIVVTSSTAGEGKTTVAGNLAVAAAAAGRRVILVGADLRKPTLAGRFGQPNGLGLTDLLASAGRRDQATDTIAEHLLDVGLRRLRLLPAGSIPHNPTELLASDRMGWLHQQLCAAADVVIYDTPPLLPVADTLEISQYVDLTFVVVRAERCHRRELTHAIERLEGVGAEVGGVVVNGLQASRGRYSYGYYRQDADEYRPRTAPEATGNGHPLAEAEPSPLSRVVVRRGATDTPAGDPDESDTWLFREG